MKLADGTAIEYKADGLNRRHSRWVNGTFDFGLVYLDKLKPIAQVDQAGNILASFVYASLSNSPDLVIKGSETYRIIHDHLGSVVFVVNTATNQVAQALTYDTWGNVLSDSNPGFQPFGFAGGLYDGATGLVRFGARDYDPTIGRWLNKDPVRFEGGWNLYGYAGNDPVNRIDPTGLDYQVCERDMNGLPTFLPDHQYIQFPDGNTISWGPSGSPLGSPGVLNQSDSGGTCGPMQPSTPFMDEAMKDWALKNENDEYNVISNNCRDFVRDAIRAGRGVH